MPIRTAGQSVCEPFWEIQTLNWHSGWLGWFNSFIINLNHRNGCKNDFVRRTKRWENSPMGNHFYLCHFEHRFLPIFGSICFSGRKVQLGVGAVCGKNIYPSLWAFENDSERKCLVRLWKHCAGQFCRQSCLLSVGKENRANQLCVWEEGKLPVLGRTNLFLEATSGVLSLYICLYLWWYCCDHSCTIFSQLYTTRSCLSSSWREVSSFCW